MSGRLVTGWEALGSYESMQGPLGNPGKDFKLNGDSQICILQRSFGCCVNELDKSKPVRRLTNIQAYGDGEVSGRGMETK